jgi:hypothetical protein
MLITYRKLRWDRHVAHMGERRNAYKIVFESLKQGELLEWFIGKSGLICFRIGTGGGVL